MESLTDSCNKNRVTFCTDFEAQIHLINEQQIKNGYTAEGFTCSAQERLRRHVATATVNPGEEAGVSQCFAFDTGGVD